jgi:lipopolysaccharide transport system ATP-binding protein
VSHDTGSVNNLCDRAIWIHDGRLRMEGKPDDVTASYRADLFGLEMKPGGGKTNSAPQPAVLSHDIMPLENSVPNSDRRMGGQACRILGVGLYDSVRRESVAAVRPGGEMTIRISLMNESVAPSTPLIVGYELFTPRGENLGGFNTLMGGFELAAPHVGEAFTIAARVTLPFLRPGHYAITPAVATHSDGEIEVQDRIENALVFEVLAEKDVGGSWMLLTTKFSRE